MKESSVESSLKPGSGRSLRRTVLKILAAGVLLCLVLAVGAAVAGVYWLKTNARAKTVELLGKRFDNVQLEALDFSMKPDLRSFRTLVASGRGLSLGLRGREGVPPFLTIADFQVEVDWDGLRSDPVRIRRLTLDRMTIQISPRREVESAASAEDSAVVRQMPVFVFEELNADGAVLLIHPRNPEKEPLQFDLHRLHMRSVGPRSPMTFEAELDNAKPPGLIRTTGTFGPLTLPDPGGSQVAGHYVFENADLAVFGGIAGRLSSEGDYAGVLERIAVKGTTQIPDFMLKPVGVPVEMSTRFSAVVDGTKGDTQLESIAVKCGSTEFTTSGLVAAKPGEKGKTVEVIAAGKNGRVEDFLKLAVKSEKPLLTGLLSFDSSILIPPGPMDVLEKLRLKGRFQIQGAEFPIPEVQEKVNLLSELGRGDRPKREGPTPKAVVSDISGAFQLEHGVMSLSNLRFRVPGSAVELAGRYDLIGEALAFRGELLTDATVSQMTGGVKSLLLKPVDPLFKRRGAGAVIPIKIEGTRSKISFGVEKGRILSRKDANPENQPNRDR